jgi:DNA-directed RNA polymerase specialized sigma24 family protein
LPKLQARQYDPAKASLHTWLYVCLERHYIQIYLEAKPQQFRKSLAPYFDEQHRSTFDPLAPLIEAEEKAIRRSRFRKGYAKRPRFAKVYDMYLDGYAYQEIADSCGMAMGTVKSNIHRFKMAVGV